MRKLILVLGLLGLLLAAGCAKAAPLPAPAPAGPQERLASLGDTASATGQDTQRLIVRTADVSLVVADVSRVVDRLSALAEELGGYVVSSERQETDGSPVARVNLRVPAEKLPDVLRELRQMATKVVAESTTSQDVTEEHVDLEAQLRNLEATEKQFLALLDRAQTVDDVLKVQREVSSVRGDIERIKGRMQYLERTAAMSLVTAHLSSEEALVTPGWSFVKTVKSAVRALIILVRAIVTAVVYAVVVLSPAWVIGGGFALYWFVLRRRGRRKP